MTSPKHYTGIINAYRDRLPIEDSDEIVTLHEGNTPLVPLPYISSRVNADVYAKVEGSNPTGSFKDRGMTLAVTKAKAQGKQVLVCASTGNTSASLAAYSVRAGLPSVIIIPAGKIAVGKIAQAVIHGTRIITIDGNFADAMDLVRQLSDMEHVGVMNSINPYRPQGQKTAAFEICEALGKAPDQHFIPVGNAANIYAYWMGYKEYFGDGIVDSTPQMRGVQADGSAPFVYGFPVENPHTIATAILIGSPASYKLALGARDESGGSITAVTDEKILEAYKMIAGKDGIFVEPGSATSIAGLLAAHERGEIVEGSTITCTVTGHGLKDPDRATADIEIPASIEPSIDEVKRILDTL